MQGGAPRGPEVEHKYFAAEIGGSCFTTLIRLDGKLRREITFPYRLVAKIPANDAPEKPQLPGPVGLSARC